MAQIPSIISGREPHRRTRKYICGPVTLTQRRCTFSYIFFYIGLAYSATLCTKTSVLVKTSGLSELLRYCHACPGVLVVAGEGAQIHAVFCEEKVCPGADPLNISVFWKKPLVVF
jgi:hypothetical protein